MSSKTRSGAWKWVFALVVLGGGLAGWRWYVKKPANAGFDYKTNLVTRGDITQAVTANGQISPVKNVTVGSQVSGIITDIRVDFNSRVTNGQVIAKIDPSTYEQNITQAEAELANARAGLELAELNAKRSKELRKNDLIPASDDDKAVVELHQAQATVRMREASLKKVNVDLERTTIYSPIDGVVISRVVDVGQTVAASFNAPTLFSIANDLRNMRIEAMVSEADVGGVQEGQKVTFTVDAFPGRQFRGEVTQVRYAPSTNQNVVNYTTVVEVNNDELKLRPGMTANASIITAQRRNVLRVPNPALRFRPPDGAVVKGATNTPAGDKAGRTADASTSAGDSSAPSREGGGFNREEMRKRFEGMTPEQREESRARMRSRFGDGPPSGGSGMFGSGRDGRSGTDAPATRTVYVLDSSSGAEKMVLKPVVIKAGITDGSYTEVLEGLNESDVVVSGVNLPAAQAAATGMRPPSSPFGGPFGGGFRPR
jgi:HlyD family secretion protein